MDVEKKTEGKALKVMEIFPSRALFILLFLLISSISCHKKNCVTLPGDIPIRTIEGDRDHIFLLGDISLSTPNCYNYLLKDIPDGVYGLGIYIYPQSAALKPNNSWNNFMLKMQVTNEKGKKVVRNCMTFNQLYETRDFTALFSQQSESEHLFLLGRGTILWCIDLEPILDWKTTAMISRIPTEWPTDPIELFLKNNPSSIFTVKSSESYSIRLETRGKCPSGIDPQAQIGLMGLNYANTFPLSLPFS